MFTFLHGLVKSLTYRPSPVLSGDLEIPLQLTFTSDKGETLDIMKCFMDSVYDWDYAGLMVNQENSVKDDEDFVLNVKDDKCNAVILLH